MFRLSLRNIGDHKGRFIMTALAVVLGVAFVVSSFVLSDTIKQTFRTLFGEANQNVDLVVRTKGGFDTGPGGIERAPLPEEALSIVRSVPGVAEADGPVQGLVPALIDPKGKQVPNAGPPTLGFSWGTSDALRALHITSGREPRPGELVLDKQTFEKYHFALGSNVTVQLTSGSTTFPLVGTFEFGSSNGFAGAHVLAWETATAQRALGREGLIDKVQIAVAPDASVKDVRARLVAGAPKGIEVVTGAQVAKEDSSTFEVIANVIGGVLLAFAGVALFVSAFYIFNTFNIILGQRTKELALLRAVGASPSQVRRAVITESLGLGIVSSLIGLGGGVLLARALQSLMSAVGFSLPATDPILKPRTAILGLVIGIGVTFLASILPAFRASTVAPLAALRDDGGTTGLTPRRRVFIGGGLTAIGALLLANGLFLADATQSVLTSLALGAIGVFLGVSVLSALVAARITGVLGLPVRKLFSTPGRLARDNATRNPQRTASTAAALTVGLALVTMATIVGASLKASVKDATNQSLRAEYLISPSGFNGFGFSPTVSDQIRNNPAVEAESPVRFGAFRLEGKTKDVTAVDPRTIDKLVDVGVTSGGFDRLTDTSILVEKDPARDLHLKVGSKVSVEFSRTGKHEFTVAGVYDDATIAGNYVISIGAYDANFAEKLDQFVAVKAASGVTRPQLERALAPVLKDFPQLKVQTREEFVGSQSSQVDQLLIVINVLLLLAIAIAVLGIANTLALSVLERIREIGLMRAVGMTRRQTRRMVRWEGAIVSTFGATIGVAVGVLFGLAALAALPTSFITSVSVPVPTLILLIVFATVAGLVAAIFPARRAGKLDVLAAIATE